jgi:hypothetical protein
MFFPIPGNPRSHEEYIKQAQRLLDTKLPFIIFTDLIFAQRLSLYENQFVRLVDLERREDDPLWLRQYVSLVRSTASHNPQKDTFAYHCVQHAKTSVMLAACNEYDLTHAAYVDVGWRWETEPLIEVYKKLGTLKTIHIPGAYNIPDWNENRCISMVNWYFLGGFFAGDRESIAIMDIATKVEALNLLADSGSVTWEVNTWANCRDKFGHKRYSADHNVSMFTNFLNS